MLNKYPFYIKSTTILFGLMLLTYALLVLQDIMIPLVFAGVTAILLNPLVGRFERIKIPRILSIILAMFCAVLLISLVLFFLSSQIAKFGDTLPLLSKKFSQILNDVQVLLREKFGLTLAKQTQMINNALENSKAVVGTTLGSVFGTLGLVLLIPIYVFMLLVYKPLIVNFFYESFSEGNSAGTVRHVLKETKTSIQSYMIGLLIEASIVAVMNSVALLIIGVPYAILLGVIGAILNLLPYIGGVVAIILPVLMATVTKEGYTTQLLIVGAYALIQFIDNNVLVPRIVSSKVKINALVSIVVVLLGGALWGVAGMFLSIPVIAICKIIFDSVPDLKPWGKLLGDDIPKQVTVAKKTA